MKTKFAAITLIFLIAVLALPHVSASATSAGSGVFIGGHELNDGEYYVNGDNGAWGDITLDPNEWNAHFCIDNGMPTLELNSFTLTDYSNVVIHTTDNQPLTIKLSGASVVSTAEDSGYDAINVEGGLTVTGVCGSLTAAAHAENTSGIYAGSGISVGMGVTLKGENENGTGITVNGSGLTVAGKYTSIFGVSANAVGMNVGSINLDEPSTLIAKGAHAFLTAPSVLDDPVTKPAHYTVSTNYDGSNPAYPTSYVYNEEDRYVRIGDSVLGPTCFVFFDSNGGVGDIDAARVTIGGDYALPACTFTAPSGMMFKEWAIGAANSETTVSANGVHAFAADTTVYAVWEVNPLQAKIDAMENGDTLTLNQDYSSLTSDVIINKLITIELGNYEIGFADGCSLVVNDGFTLEISRASECTGKITNVGGSAPLVVVNGDLNMQSGVISASGTAIDNQGAGFVNISGGTTETSADKSVPLIINSGTGAVGLSGDPQLGCLGTYIKNTGSNGTIDVCCDISSANAAPIIENTGTLTLFGTGVLKNTANSALKNKGGTATVNMTGTGKLVSSYQMTADNMSKGTLIVQGGTIEYNGSNGDAINNRILSSVAISGQPSIIGRVSTLSAINGNGYMGGPVSVYRSDLANNTNYDTVFGRQIVSGTTDASKWTLTNANMTLAVVGDHLESIPNVYAAVPDSGVISYATELDTLFAIVNSNMLDKSVTIYVGKTDTFSSIDALVVSQTTTLKSATSTPQALTFGVASPLTISPRTGESEFALKNITLDYIKTTNLGIQLSVGAGAKVTGGITTYDAVIDAGYDGTSPVNLTLVEPSAGAVAVENGAANISKWNLTNLEYRLVAQGNDLVVKSFPYLPMPLQPAWNSNIAVWSAVTNASGYEVTIWKENGVNPVATVECAANYCDISEHLSESGSCVVAVKALGDGLNYQDSAESLPSDAQTFYAVEFVPMNGESNFTKYAASGTCVADPSQGMTNANNPTQRLLNWYYYDYTNPDNPVEAAWNFSDAVTGDISLWANWVDALQYDIEFAASTTGTLTLTHNYTLTQNVFVNSAITVDLNGHTVDCGADYYIGLMNSASALTLADGGTGGAIEGTNGAGILSISAGTLDIQGGTIDATEGTNYAIIASGGSVTVSGGTVKGNNYSIYGNGSSVLSIAVSSGTVSAATGNAIEVNSVANLTVSGSAAVTGGTAAINAVGDSNVTVTGAPVITGSVIAGKAINGTGYTGGKITVGRTLSEDLEVVSGTADMNKWDVADTDYALVPNADNDALIAKATDCVYTIAQTASPATSVKVCLSLTEAFTWLNGIDGSDTAKDYTITVAPRANNTAALTSVANLRRTQENVKVTLKGATSDTTLTVSGANYIQVGNESGKEHLVLENIAITGSDATTTMLIYVYYGSTLDVGAGAALRYTGTTDGFDAANETPNVVNVISNLSGTVNVLKGGKISSTLGAAICVDGSSDSKGTVNIMGGEVSISGKAHDAIRVGANGSANVSSGIVLNDDAKPVLKSEGYISSFAIKNNGTAIITGGTVSGNGVRTEDESENVYAINNEGTLELSGGDILCDFYSIVNGRFGNLTISDTAYVKSEKGASINNCGGNVFIQGGTVTHGKVNKESIDNSGELTMSGGTVQGIINNGAGTVEVSDGTLTLKLGDSEDTTGMITVKGAPSIANICVWHAITDAGYTGDAININYVGRSDMSPLGLTFVIGTNNPEKWNFVNAGYALIGDGEGAEAKLVAWQTMPAPTEPLWDADNPGTATWTAATDATGYSVQLYKDGEALGTAVSVSAAETSCGISDLFGETGTYTFKVTAKGNAAAYLCDSPASAASDGYAYVKPLDKPTNIAWDTTVPGKAKWSAVANATGYIVQLNESNMVFIEPVTVAVGVTEYDFTFAITETGSYTFIVTAIGDGVNNANSQPSVISGTYDYVKPTLTSITAAFTQGSTAVYTSASIYSLKPMLTVTAVYSDNSEVAVTDYNLVGRLIAGTSQVTVNYDGMSATFSVNVTAVAVAGISASFAQGENIVYTSAALDELRPMLTVTYTNNDGTSGTTVEYALSGTLAAGSSTITATYKEKSATFSVNVTAVALKSISAQYNQSKLVYEGDTLASLKPKLLITGANNDGTTFDITEGYTLEGTLSADTSTITVKYQGKSTTVDVDVIPVTLQTISAAFTQGANTVYTSTKLDSLKSMLKVTGTNNNGTTFNITGYALSGSLTAGTPVITVSYEGKFATFSVNVTAVTFTGITAEFAQGTAAVYTSNTLDSLRSMLTVKRVYNDGSSNKIDSFLLTGALTAGDCTITASYEDKTATFTVNVTAVAMTGITASFTQGEKVVYTSTSLEVLRSMLTVTCMNNDGTIVTTTGYALSGTLAAGSSTITATLNGKTATFSVNVTAVALESLLVSFNAAIPTYAGDELTSLKSKLSVRGVNNDTNTFAIADGYTLEGTLTQGKCVITLKYQGKSTTFDVDVLPVELVSMTVTFTQGTNKIYTSSTLDSLKSMLKVTGHYNNGTTANITNYNLSGLLTEGQSEITVGCEGQLETFYVTVTKVALASISAKFTQGDTVVYTSNTLDSLKSMLTVTGTNNDGSAANTTGYALSGTLTAGTSTITVSYGGKSTTLTVKVTAVELTSISAAFSQGSAAVYTSSSLDSLKPKLTVTGKNNDGSSVDTAGYTLSGTLTAGTSTINVAFGGKTTSFTVNVTAVELSSITATFEQGSTVVYPGSSLNALKDMLTLTGTNNDGTTKNIAEYTLSGTLTEGTSVITVTFGGKSTTFSVTVTKVTLASISASFNQGTTVIYAGGALDSLKPMLTVTGTYSDGKSGNITGYTLSGTLAEGTSTVTVTFDGKTAAFSVTVTKVILTFDHNELLLCVNDQQRISIEVFQEGLPEIHVEWTSSDTSVATVNAEGRVTASGVGTATITATLTELPGAMASCQVTVGELMTMTLPGALTEIKEEAFMNTPFERIVAGENLTRIEARAFKGCTSLRIVEVGASVTYIADDAFEGCTDIIIVCPAGSEAERYAKRMNFEYYTR